MTTAVWRGLGECDRCLTQIELITDGERAFAECATQWEPQGVCVVGNIITVLCGNRWKGYDCTGQVDFNFADDQRWSSKEPFLETFDKYAVAMDRED